MVTVNFVDTDGELSITLRDSSGRRDVKVLADSQIPVLLQAAQALISGTVPSVASPDTDDFECYLENDVYILRFKSASCFYVEYEFTLGQFTEFINKLTTVRQSMWPGPYNSECE